MISVVWAKHNYENKHKFPISRFNLVKFASVRVNNDHCVSDKASRFMKGSPAEWWKAQKQLTLVVGVSKLNKQDWIRATTWVVLNLVEIRMYLLDDGAQCVEFPVLILEPFSRQFWLGTWLSLTAIDK